MSKRTVYTDISPLPPTLTRAAVVEFLHNHLEMIDLNPLVKERHPIAAPEDAPEEERLRCSWYSLTDKIAYLPGGMATGDVSYTAAFHDLPNGIQTHCRAPLGVDVRSRWTVCGSLPGEPPERAEIGIGAPPSGLYIREDVDLRCNLLMAAFVKRTTKKAHGTLVEHLAAKAKALADHAAAADTPVQTLLAQGGGGRPLIQWYGAEYGEFKGQSQAQAQAQRGSQNHGWQAMPSPPQAMPPPPHPPAYSPGNKTQSPGGSPATNSSYGRSHSHSLGGSTTSSARFSIDSGSSAGRNRSDSAGTRVSLLPSPGPFPHSQPGPPQWQHGHPTPPSSQRSSPQPSPNQAQQLQQKLLFAPEPPALPIQQRFSMYANLSATTPQTSPLLRNQHQQSSPLLFAHQQHRLQESWSALQAPRGKQSRQSSPIFYPLPPPPIPLQHVQSRPQEPTPPQLPELFFFKEEPLTSALLRLSLASQQQLQPQQQQPSPPLYPSQNPHYQRMTPLSSPQPAIARDLPASPEAPQYGPPPQQQQQHQPPSSATIGSPFSIYSADGRAFHSPPTSPSDCVGLFPNPLRIRKGTPARPRRCDSPDSSLGPSSPPVSLMYPEMNPYADGDDSDDDDYYRAGPANFSYENTPVEHHAVLDLPPTASPAARLPPVSTATTNSSPAADGLAFAELPGSGPDYRAYRPAAMTSTGAGEGWSETLRR